MQRHDPAQRQSSAHPSSEGAAAGHGNDVAGSQEMDWLVAFLSSREFCFSIAAFAFVIWDGAITLHEFFILMIALIFGGPRMASLLKDVLVRWRREEGLAAMAAWILAASLMLERGPGLPTEWKALLSVVGPAIIFAGNGSLCVQQFEACLLRRLRWLQQHGLMPDAIFTTGGSMHDAMGAVHARAARDATRAVHAHAEGEVKAQAQAHPARGSSSSRESKRKVQARAAAAAEGGGTASGPPVLGAAAVEDAVEATVGCGAVATEAAGREAAGLRSDKRIKKMTQEAQAAEATNAAAAKAAKAAATAKARAKADAKAKAKPGLVADAVSAMLQPSRLMPKRTSAASETKAAAEAAAASLLAEEAAEAEEHRRKHAKKAKRKEAKQVKHETDTAAVACNETMDVAAGDQHDGEEERAQERAQERATAHDTAGASAAESVGSKEESHSGLLEAHGQIQMRPFDEKAAAATEIEPRAEQSDLPVAVVASVVEGLHGSEHGGEHGGEHEAECVVCMEALPTHASVPCGHRCICARCSEDLVRGRADGREAQLKCPMCRGAVQMFMRVF